MTPHQRRVVVTGMGIVCAGGCDVESVWTHLIAGVPSVAPIRRFDASGYPSRIAAEIIDGDFRRSVDLPPEWALRGRIAQYMVAAAQQAIEAAGLLEAGDRRRIGVSLASGSAGIDHDELFAACCASRGSSDDTDWHVFAETLQRTLKPRSAERRTPGSVAALIAAQYAVSGPVLCTMNACAGGTQAIGDALRWIQRGRADAVIAGGADSELDPLGLASFCLLGALSTRNHDPGAASRPFDRARDGFVLGEGAGVLVLEERESALARRAPVIAEVAGFGSACDAYRATDPHPEGVGAALAMQRALGSAGLDTEQVDYINAHGTSTPANDRIETLATNACSGTGPPASRSARPTSARVP